MASAAGSDRWKLGRCLRTGSSRGTSLVGQAGDQGRGERLRTRGEREHGVRGDGPAVGVPAAVPFQVKGAVGGHDGDADAGHVPGLHRGLDAGVDREG